MKKPPTRRRSSTPLSVPVRHQFDHAVPTVIHHPEEKMTALARWAHRVVMDPKKYLTWTLATLAGAFVLYGVWKWTTADGSPASDVWVQLKEAKTPEDRLEIARKHPESPAAMWTMLQVASEQYNSGLADMPHNRDVALQAFKKAQALYDELVEKAPKDPKDPSYYVARAALMGKARTLEARNERAEAIKQYEQVVANWPDSPEAAQAAEYAAALGKPEAAAFYKELYAYAPTKVTLPALGTGLINSPIKGGPNTGAKTGSGADTLPDLPLVFPPSIEEAKNAASAKPEGKLPDLPADVFSSKKPAPAKEKGPR